MNKALLSLIFLLITPLIWSQNKNNVLTKKELKAIAIDDIQKMKNGALIVRLKTKQNSISALRKSGQNKRADKLEAKQAAYNINIIEGFKTNFDFCPTYFFYSNFSQEVLDKEFTKVEFLNDSLQFDPTITFNHTTYLTAEFGIIEQDTAKYFDNYYYVQGKNGKEKKTSYNGSTDMTFGALIIKSDQFFQLRKPFPYYSRTLATLPIKRKPKLVIKEMNIQLHRFYNSAN